MIYGQRITIAPFETEEHVQEFVQMYNNMIERSPLDHDEQANLSNKLDAFRHTQFQSGKEVNYRILNEKQELIGTIGFTRESEFELVIGYRILNHRDRGVGYMSEALRLFLPFLFESEPVIDRLSLYIHEENLPSIALACKFHFTYEGTMREAYQFRANRVGMRIYSLLRSEYQTL